MAEIFDYGPADEMQKKYSLYAENRQSPSLDPEKVPAELRHLIPYAERYGEPCSITRGDILDKASDAELDEFKRALSKRDEKLLREWMEQEDDSSAEYLAFLYMETAYAEISVYPLYWLSRVVGEVQNDGQVKVLINTDGIEGGVERLREVASIPADCRRVGDPFLIVVDRHGGETYYPGGSSICIERQAISDLRNLARDAIKSRGGVPQNFPAFSVHRQMGDGNEEFEGPPTLDRVSEVAFRMFDDQQILASIPHLQRLDRLDRVEFHSLPSKRVVTELKDSLPGVALVDRNAKPLA